MNVTINPRAAFLSVNVAIINRREIRSIATGEVVVHPGIQSKVSPLRRYHTRSHVRIQMRSIALALCRQRRCQ